MSQFGPFFRRWRLFFLYCAFIYLSLPVAPGLWRKFEAGFGNFAAALPFIILSLSGAIILFKFSLLRKRRRSLGICIICAVFSISFVILRNLEIQAERIHLIEYIILAAIIYRSLEKNQKRSAIYFKILTIGLVVGFLDEIIQYFLPNRVFDWRDCFLNGAGVFLGEILVYNMKDMP